MPFADNHLVSILLIPFGVINSPERTAAPGGWDYVTLVGLNFRIAEYVLVRVAESYAVEITGDMNELPIW